MKYMRIVACMLAIFLCLQKTYAEDNNVTYYFYNETDGTVPLIFTVNSEKGIYTRTVRLLRGESHLNIQGCLVQLRTFAPDALVKRGIDVNTVFKLNAGYMCSSVRTTIRTLSNGSIDLVFSYD